MLGQWNGVTCDKIRGAVLEVWDQRPLNMGAPRKSRANAHDIGELAKVNFHFLAE